MDIKKQKGFALLDTMIAALILAVASVAYIKLQNVSLQRALKANYSLQASQTISSAIELMRATPGMANWILTKKGGSFVVTKDAAKLNECNGESGLKLMSAGAWCGKDKIFSKNFSIIEEIFSDNFKNIEGLAVFCVVRSATNTEKYSFSVVWKNAFMLSGAGNFSNAVKGDCPKEYTSNYSLRIKEGAYPDRGYVTYKTLLK